MRQAEHDRRVWDDEGEERRRGRAGRIPVSCQGCECKRRAARSVSNPPFENICTRHGCLFWPPICPNQLPSLTSSPQNWHGRAEAQGQTHSHCLALGLLGSVLVAHGCRIHGSFASYQLHDRLKEGSSEKNLRRDWESRRSGFG